MNFDELFTDANECDYCKLSNPILQIILCPIFGYDDNDEMGYKGYTFTMKCSKCLVEEINYEDVDEDEL